LFKGKKVFYHYSGFAKICKYFWLSFGGKYLELTFDGPVVQWIGHNPAKIVTQVQLLVGPNVYLLIILNMHNLKTIVRYLLSVVMVIVGWLLFWGNYPIEWLAIFSLGMIGLFISTKL
jgi:hypothetical protein